MKTRAITLSLVTACYAAIPASAQTVTYSASAPTDGVEVFYDPSAGDLGAYAGDVHPSGVRGITDNNKNENIGQTFTTGSVAFTLDAITLLLHQKSSSAGQEYFINVYSVPDPASYPTGPGGTDQRISSTTFVLDEAEVGKYMTIDVEDAALAANSTYMYVIGCHTASGTDWTRFTSDEQVGGDYAGGAMSNTIEPVPQTTSRIDDLPAGWFTDFDQVFYLQSAVPPAEPLITDFTVIHPDTISITWNSITGNQYGLENSTTLDSFDQFDTVVATGPSTTYTRSGVTLPAAEFFRIANLGAAPPVVLFDEGFESGATGWVATNLSGTATTVWEIGMPSGTFINAANSGANAAGTALAGTFEEGTDTVLRSPTIDFTGYPSATLTWHQAKDFEANDFAQINLRKQDGSETIPLKTVTDDGGENSDWEEDRVAIPIGSLDEAALDQYQLEFVFTDGGLADLFEGWYIDDVKVAAGY